MKPQEGQYFLIYASPPPPGDMSPEEIMDLEVEGLPVRHLAAQDAVCLMWCTPSILPRAIAALEAWGFAYQTHFIWDKQRTGAGSICLNQHELLLYGSRGNAPVPMKLFPSIFRSERGAHNVKPTVVREMVEAMFPHCNEHTRIELFHRGDDPVGWTVWRLDALNVEEAA